MARVPNTLYWSEVAWPTLSLHVAFCLLRYTKGTSIGTRSR